MTDRNAAHLRRRIRLWLWVFIIGLVLSGVTALPLTWELDQAAAVVGHGWERAGVLDAARSGRAA